MSFASDFSELRRRLERVQHLSDASSILAWDEQVCLPAGGLDGRSGQLAILAELAHREATAPEIGGLLGKLESHIDPVSAEVSCTLREARRDYDRAVRIPADFAARQAALSSQAYHHWTIARTEGDFAKFAPWLERQLDSAREEAGYLGFKEDAAYDYHIEKHDPGMTAARIAALFDPLREGLVPLAKAVLESPNQADTSFLTGFDPLAQERFLREVLAGLGFDFSRGRLDKSVHPFCGGCLDDVRMTTRYDADNPLDSLFSSIHEAGHGLYEQGLPSSWRGCGPAKPAGMAVHESQSRLWENMVARSAPFWKHWEPRYRAAFPEKLAGVTTDQLHRAFHAVARQPIRVDADEVTYNLHVMLRFDLEKRLFAGTLTVKDLPDAWIALAEELLGLTPKNHKEGCLQDVHWSGGAFGYFPSYTLGNMLAAQLWHKVRQDLPQLDHDLARGDCSALLKWLRTNVHQRGRQLDLDALAVAATGETLSPARLLAYLKERYGAIYGV